MLIKVILEVGMKAPSSTIRDMDMALSSIMRVGNILEIGRKIKCMGKEYYTTPIKK